MKRFEFSCFADFFKDFTTREEYDFCKIRQWRELGIAWNKRLESFVKLMTKNSISGLDAALL